MICAYCGKEAKGTKEHIISCGVLDLFPECFATIDGERKVVHQSDPLVKDVCADCNNNRINYIDSYAKSFIEKYFLTKYSKDDELNIEYDNTMMQKMCLKYAFNDLRSRKKDISFFNDTIISFLLNQTETEALRNVTILAGLAVNTSPVPDSVFGNLKLRWSDSPYFCSNSLVMNVDYNTGKITLRDKMEPENFNKRVLSYVFRFNSLQLLLLCWDESISEDELLQNKIVLEHLYPYKILDVTGRSIITRCTSEATYHQEKIIDVSIGQEMLDEISFMRGTFTDEYQRFLSSVESEWTKEEKTLADKHPR